MIPASVPIFVCTELVDMRKSFDGLICAARERLGRDVQSGGLFVFCNKRHNRLKVLWFDGNGYCILYKRIHGALFRLPNPDEGGIPIAAIDPRQLAAVLRGVERPKWRRHAA